MVGLYSVQFIIKILTLLFAYIFTVTLAGSFRAWVIEKMGDSTARERGFLTLNPLVHIDPIGIFTLFLFDIGWGRQVPFSPLNIHGKWRSLRLGIAILSGVFVHLFLVLVTLIALIFFGGINGFFLDNANISSLTLALLRIANVFINLNIFLAVIELVVNVILIVTLFLTKRYAHYQHYMYYVLSFVPFVILFLFGGYLWYVLRYGLLYIGFFLAHLFGG